MTQEQLRHSESEKEEVVEEMPSQDRSDTKPDMDALDKLMDEIDVVLEENAAEYVKQFQQRGGQ